MSAAELPVEPFRRPDPPLAPVGPASDPEGGAPRGGGRRLAVAAFLAWLPLAVAVVVLAGLVYVTVQQTLRRGADDPQLQIAGDMAAQLSGGAQPGPLLGTSRVDLATSLSPYVIVFDAAGHPVASTGVLDGVVPSPPAGVLRAAGQHRTELTWQPRHGVRSAIVVVPFQAASGRGTVLVGRSLTEVEKREAVVLWMVAASLVAGLGATAAACLVAAWLRRRLSPSPAG
jgi:hypothetical protein